VESATLKSIVDAMSGPALVLSSRYRIVQANRDAEEFFETDLAGLDVVRVMRQPEIRQLLTNVTEARSRQTTEITVHKNVPRTFLVSVGPLKNGEPDNVDLLMTLSDISDQLQAEQSRSTFVANVSHELRSPLTTLIGAVETLQGPARDNPAAQDRFLGLMSAEARRMSRLVADLLNLAKQEAQEFKRPDQSVSMENVLRQVTDALGASDAYHENRIRLDIGSTPPVKGSEDDLFEAFRNLIENALRYSPPDSPVDVSLALARSSSPVREDMAVIEIRDFGDGVDAEHLPRLTDRFYRVDKGRSREMGGTGLGLAIVKHIVNRHRGRLGFSSTLGNGTVVTVHLPIA